MGCDESQENLGRRETTPYGIIMMDTCHTCHIHLSKPIEYTKPRDDPNVKYGFGVIMMSQCRFINYNTLLGGCW